MKKLLLILLTTIFSCYCYSQHYNPYNPTYTTTTYHMPPTSSIQKMDIELLRAINTPYALHSDGFFRTISNADMFIITGVPLTMELWGRLGKDKKLSKTADILVVSTAANVLFTTAIKFAVNRQRPFNTYPDIINKSGKPTEDASFPSGHTSTAFMLATFLTLEYPKWYVIIPTYTYAALVGYSRMHLGVHYPTDVICGAIIGSGCAILTHIIVRKLENK
jgi:membrane-associated phospholipid phosphatase